MLTRVEKVTPTQNDIPQLVCDVKKMFCIIGTMTWSIDSRNFTQVSSDVRQWFRSVGELRNSGDVVSVLTAAVNFLEESSELPDLRKPIEEPQKQSEVIQGECVAVSWGVRAGVCPRLC